jgi:DNA repair exonuclease SbcCD ATPase subunit
LEAFRTTVLASAGNAADSETVEAAHITWRPLGRLLVERGLLTGDELEQALTEQQATGQRLGETIVKLGFVSGPELASALAAQYGIELTTEKGFGTGLRSEIQRRHESDRRRVVQLVPNVDNGADSEPAPETEATILELVPAAEHAPDSGEEALFAQLEEQWAKLAAAEAALAERERELTELAESRERESAALAEIRERELAELAESHRRDLQDLEELNQRLREELAELRNAPMAAEYEEPAAVAPTSHLLFVQLDERYELIARDGPPPLQSTPLSLPDVDEGTFVAAGLRASPLPDDRRPCVFVQRG